MERHFTDVSLKNLVSANIDVFEQYFVAKDT